jgi:hypothetical protein
MLELPFFMLSQKFVSRQGIQQGFTDFFYRLKRYFWAFLKRLDDTRRQMKNIRFLCIGALFGV